MKLPLSLVFSILLPSMLASCVEPGRYRPIEEPPPTVPPVPALRFPPNNSYRGSVITGSLRPTFQWEPSDWTGPEVVRYQLEAATDRTFTTTVIKVETTGTSHQPTSNLPASMKAPVGARYFWRVKACVNEVCSEPSPTWWVNLGRTERDINGDGFADVVVVAPGSTEPSTTAGRLHFFRGGAGGGFDSVADTIASNAWYMNVMAAGDVNADGFADLIAQVKDSQTATASRLIVLLGGAGATLDTSPDASITDIGAALPFFGSARDLNGDGFDDLVIYRRRDTSVLDLYFGGSGLAFDTTPDASVSEPAPSELFGFAFDSAGDVNGDGYADLVIAARDSDATGEDAGRAYVLFGGSDALSQSPQLILSGAAAGDAFGWSVSSAGDVNGDGFSDVVIGAPRNDSKGNNAGRAYVYFGASNTSMDAGADGVLTGPSAEFHFGQTVSSAGDLNDDGYDDIAVSCIESLFRGCVHIYLGGSGSELDSFSDAVLEGEANGDYFGYRVVAADVNGDNVEDLLVGAPFHSSAGPSTGRAYVYLGAAGRSLDSLPDGYLSGAARNDNFGSIAALRARAGAHHAMARRAPTSRR